MKNSPLDNNRLKDTLGNEYVFDTPYVEDVHRLDKLSTLVNQFCKREKQINPNNFKEITSINLKGIFVDAKEPNYSLVIFNGLSEQDRINFYKRLTDLELTCVCHLGALFVEQQIGKIKYFLYRHLENMKTTKERIDDLMKVHPAIWLLFYIQIMNSEF